MPPRHLPNSLYRDTATAHVDRALDARHAARFVAFASEEMRADTALIAAPASRRKATPMLQCKMQHASASLFIFQSDDDGASMPARHRPRSRRKAVNFGRPPTRVVDDFAR